MRRTITGLLLAAALLAPVAVVADEPEPGQGPTETKPVDRLAELRKQREETQARRDRALLGFHTYGLPKYSLEVEAMDKELERLDKEIAEAEKTSP